MNMKTMAAVAATAAMLFGAAPASAAAITTYTDAAAFAAAAGPLSLETFNGVVGQPEFRTSPLTVGDLTLQGFGPSQFDRNYIDQPPAQSSINDVDGTPFATVYTLSDNDFISGLTISFSHSVTAFGGTFADWNDSFLRGQISVLGQLVEPTVTIGNQVRFFGFVSDTPLNQLTFQAEGIFGDSFGLDNVLSSSGAVPEPSAWALMILGFGTAGAALRRRRAAPAG